MEEGKNGTGTGITPTDRALLQEEFDRRRFLILTGSAGVGIYLSSARGAFAALSANGPNTTPTLTFSADVRRPDDFLSLHFDFWNLELVPSPTNPVLVRKNANKFSYLVVGFPPQGMAEEAFYEAAPEFSDPVSNPLPAPGNVGVRLAGTSWLAFSVPGNVSIPFTYEGLLNWASFAPKIVPVASNAVSKVGPFPTIREPAPYETALEIPWRLVLSPNEQSGWKHAIDKVTHNGRTELWHTRLGVRKEGQVDEHEKMNRTIRAIWSRDPNFENTVKDSVPGPSASPFLASLDASDREGIVRATSDYTIGIGRGGTYEPLPADVDMLMLTALGAWVDIRGHWDVPLPNSANLTLEDWRHRGAMGRDSYVRIVKKGFLYPFRHPAVMVKVTERKIQAPNAFAKNAAYLRQRTFVIVRKPLRTFGGAPGQSPGGRAFPFDEVRITTLITPNLQPPTSNDLGAAGVPSGQAWIPRLAPGVPFLFHAIGTDKEGRKHEFTTPLVFVDGAVATNKPQVDAIVAKYATAADDVRRAKFSGAPVAIAHATKVGDTDVEIKTLLLDGESAIGSPPVGEPLFFPRMASAQVRLAAAEQASGGSVSPEIQYFPDYVTNGFTAREVFAQLVSGAPLSFPTDKSGGVMQPNFTINAISRKLGPTGGADPATMNAPTINPTEFFGAAGKLLGGVLLKDILGVISDLEGDKALKLKTTQEGDNVVTNLSWKPDLVSTDIFDAGFGPATMDLEAKIIASATHPEQSTFTIHGDLRSFALNLIAPDGAASFLRLEFTRLSFESKKGQSANVDVDISKVEFKGVLKFVQDLQEMLSIGGGDGPGAGIDLTPTGISANFHVPIPNIQIGIFGITNLSFAAGLTIPFDGKPVRARFGFSTREDVFHIQVSFFAGGGFFALAIGADGVEQVEAALEFGAQLALDVGVASGSVSAMAGVYFSYGKDPDHGDVLTTILTGYIRLRGELSVIEIVNLTLEFYLAFTYEHMEPDIDKVTGQASMTVTVSVLIFSGDVTISVERHFGNGPNDPTFAQQISPSDWSTYANAFAEVA